MSSTADEGAHLAAQRPLVEEGRVTVYAALGAYAGAIPLPWLPDAAMRRVRGALIHDLASAHGLSLTPDAREILADPRGPRDRQGLPGHVLRFVSQRVATRALRSIGPVGLLWRLRGSLDTYVLGRLFERYLALRRTERAVRIESDEAHRVREAIDRSLAHAISTTPDPQPLPTSIDDQRDAITALIDELLAQIAGVPSRLVRRLDAAFDDLIQHGDR
jgi:hypothetical protein